jgi:hypothetical protein
VEVQLFRQGIPLEIQQDNVASLIEDLPSYAVLVRVHGNAEIDASQRRERGLDLEVSGVEE